MTAPSPMPMAMSLVCHLLTYLVFGVFSPPPVQALLCKLDEAGVDEVLALYFGSDAVTPIHRCRMKLWHLHTTSREALWCIICLILPFSRVYSSALTCRPSAVRTLCANNLASVRGDRMQPMPTDAD